MLGRLTGACRRWWGGGRWGSGSGGLGGRGSCSSSSSSRRRSGRGRGRVFGGCRLAHGVCGLHKMLKMGEEEEEGGVSRVRLPKWPRRAGFEGFIFVPLRPGAARVRAGSHEVRNAISTHLVTYSPEIMRRHARRALLPLFHRSSPPTANQATRVAPGVGNSVFPHQDAGRAGVMLATLRLLPYWPVVRPDFLLSEGR